MTLHRRTGHPERARHAPPGHFGPQRFADAQEFGTVQLRTGPNAGARHEVEAYVIALNVAVLSVQVVTVTAGTCEVTVPAVPRIDGAYPHFRCGPQGGVSTH